MLEGVTHASSIRGPCDSKLLVFNMWSGPSSFE